MNGLTKTLNNMKSIIFTLILAIVMLLVSIQILHPTPKKLFVDLPEEAPLISKDQSKP